MVERKKARRTVDDLIAEEQKTMKPRFLHHKDQAAEMRLGLQQARATASSFASEKANLHDKRRRSTSEAEVNACDLTLPYTMSLMAIC